MVTFAPGLVNINGGLIRETIAVIRFCTFFVFLITVGCSGGEDYVYNPADFRPKVDESQPPEVQEKQAVLIRAFGSVQGGWNIPDLPERHPDVRIDEPPEEFYEEGALLHAFKWNGPPTDRGFPLRLVMKKDEPGLPEVEYTRVYSVTKEGDIYVIRREK